MARKRITFLFSLIVLGSLLLLATPNTRAQCGEPPDAWRTFEDYTRVCAKYGGRIVNRRCVDWNTNWCHRGEATTPAATDDSAKENARLEEERAEAARNRTEAEAEAQRKQKEEDQKKFDSDKAEVMNSLKDISTGDLELRDADTIKDKNNSSFQIKGVDDTKIKDLKPDNEDRGWGTDKAQAAWKQLNYAFALGDHADKVFKRQDLSSEARDDEIRYLASEGIRALNGEPLGVKLDITIKPLDKVHAQQLDKAIPAYKSLLQSVIAEVDKKRALKKEAQEQGAKPPLAETSATAQKSATSSQQDPASPKQQNAGSRPRRSKDDEKIAAAYATDKATQAEQAKRIREVFKQQKDLEQKKDDDAMRVVLASMANFEKQMELNQGRPPQRGTPPPPPPTTPARHTSRKNVP